jgi:hypothetical protein
MFFQEFPVGVVKVGDAIEDIPPQIKIIPLMDDPVILTDGQLGAAEEWCGWIFIERQHHLPLEEDVTGFFDDREDLHVELPAAFYEPATHGLEVIDPLHFLDAIFKDDVLVVVREEVRPVRFPLPVVSQRPEFTYPFGCQWFHIDLALVFFLLISCNLG